MRKVIVKVIASGSFPAVLVVALSAGPAEASTQETCTVSSILFQPAQPPTVPEDLLLVSCTDSTSYIIYVGTPGGCYADINAVQSMEAVALTARLTGNPMTIWWTAVSCPGNAGARIMNTISM
jgi:hypothetical protein